LVPENIFFCEKERALIGGNEALKAEKKSLGSFSISISFRHFAKRASGARVVKNIGI